MALAAIALPLLVSENTLANSDPASNLTVLKVPTNNLPDYVSWRRTFLFFP